MNPANPDILPLLLSVLLLVSGYLLGATVLIAVALPRYLRDRRDTRISNDFSDDRPGFDTTSPRP